MTGLDFGCECILIQISGQQNFWSKYRSGLNFIQISGQTVYSQFKTRR